MKLCDFGLASYALEDAPVSRVGTLEFMAPEVAQLPKRSREEMTRLRVQREAQYDSKVDIWPLGCIACARPARRAAAGCGRLGAVWLPM